jgi:hypothetical protein
MLDGRTPINYPRSGRRPPLKEYAPPERVPLNVSGVGDCSVARLLHQASEVVFRSAIAALGATTETGT